VDRDTLRAELKQLVVEALQLDDVAPETIADEDPLFGEGLGLDSIDALELAVAIERRYRVAIPDETIGKQAFRNIATLADFIQARS
jgi:acyl carrier protein